MRLIPADPASGGAIHDGMDKTVDGMDDEGDGAEADGGDGPLPPGLGHRREGPGQAVQGHGTQSVDEKSCGRVGKKSVKYSKII